MENDSLYLALKNKLCESIYRGVYQDGENIPPERTLSENLGVSRVTVRKALTLLEKDGIIERVQGSGTLVKLKQTGYKGTLDIIALLAPATNPFFAAFIDDFQKNADKNDSLVLFMQNPKHSNVEDSLFKLFQKNIRNVVVWLEDLQVDYELIRRLRGLGMNIVFFDMSEPSPYADCVLLDNQDAIKMLCQSLIQKGAVELTYVGWDNLQLSSVRERERAFKTFSGGCAKVFHVPRKERDSIQRLMGEITEQIKAEKIWQNAFICGDGDLGVALKKAFLVQGIRSDLIASVDDSEEAKLLTLSVYRQSFQELSQKVYECLLKQNRKAKAWKAKVYAVKGELIER
ncbi:LacI family DNA-binding transcriptional regulator [Cellulosilyticum sp. I15G10I2]|uniref:LacI family DNA-binding transcriptional regulator n=1 Tax=Cellulosilyticum sp. I15G10I2 TaxID=1892843 RepID=UPI00085C3559|nr:LacI family DNA-binding transcriptional regulator [Cellulosilyticum sp. I15G10I2]